MPQDGLGIDNWPQSVAATLLDLSADLACTISFDAGFQDITGDWFELAGWSAEELRSRSMLSFIHDDDVALTRTELDRARGGATAVKFQNRLCTADGSTRWLLWAVIGDPDTQSFRAVVRDLSARHEAESLVHESEQRYLDLIESAHDIVQSILPDGHFGFVNRAWHESLGYTTEELSGLTLFDIVDEVDHDHCTLMIGQIMSGKSFDHIEITFVAKDGHTFPVEGNATGRFRNGEFVATHTFFRDVSDRKQAEALQAAYQRQLEEEVAERSAALVQSEKLATLGRLSAGMAHELNNPAAAAQRGAALIKESFSKTGSTLVDLALTVRDPDEASQLRRLLARASEAELSAALQLDPLSRNDREEEVESWLAGHGLEHLWAAADSLVELGLAEEDLDALADTFGPDHIGAALTILAETRNMYTLIAQVGHGSERISQIVAALKEYSYMDRAAVQDVNVHDGLEGTLVMLQSKLKQGVEVVRDYDRDAPRIETLGSELNQVWTNIIDNAVDAMGGSGRLTIRTRPAEGGISVEIEDDGPGIPADALAHVFDPFFTTKPPGQGTGLGLNIVFNMIRASGGTIDVRSAPESTVFRIWLPLRRPVDAAGSGTEKRSST